MDIENNTDLVDFINKEKLKYNELNQSKIHKYFSKCFIKTIIEIDNKFKNLESEIGNHNGVILGTNMLFHVFWILISYTNNIRLTIFLSERAILLFTEFVIMAKEPSIKDDLCYIPNILDAVAFAYKKTIGPLIISDLSTSNLRELAFIKDSCSILKSLYQDAYLSYVKKDTITISLQKYLDLINNNFRLLFYKIYTKKNDFFVYEKIKSIIHNNNNIDKSLVFIKIYFEIFNQCLSKNISIQKLEHVFNLIYEKFKNYDFQVSNIQEIKNYKKIKLYLDLKKELLNVL